MPLSCKLAGGSGGSGSGTGDGTSLNIFTQPNEPDIKDGIWVKKTNTHKKIVVDNRISTEGEWSDIVTDCPFSVGQNANPVLYRDKIAVVANNDSGLWTFDGGTWTNIGSKPPIGYNGISIVLNNVLYFLGGYGDLYEQGIEMDKGICRWDGTSWVGSTSLPFEITYQNGIAVYNGYIYCLIPDYTNEKTCLWRSSGNSFTKVTTMNYVVTDARGGFVYNNKIYWILDYYNSSSIYYHQVLVTCDGSSVTLNAGSTPLTNNDLLISGVLYDGVIHAILRFYSTGEYKHYKYDGTTWTNMFSMPGEMFLCPLNTRLYAFCGTQRMYFSKAHEKYDPHTLVLQISSSHDGPYSTAFVNTSSLITGENNRFVSNFDDAFFIGEDGIDTTDPIYYGNGTQWVKFKN